MFLESYIDFRAFEVFNVKSKSSSRESSFRTRIKSLPDFFHRLAQLHQHNIGDE